MVMFKRTILAAAVSALALTAAVPAQAATRPTPFLKYTLSGTGTVSGSPIGYRAYALLPQKLPDLTANGGSVLRFGPIGSCRFNLSVSLKVVERSGDETAAARAARLAPATPQYVYAEGTRASAAWRVTRLKGSQNVRGIYVMPGAIGTSTLFGAPTKPVWIEVRGTANEHVAECHSGGPRYIGDSLATAFGAMTSTAFATRLPRAPLPPKP